MIGPIHARDYYFAKAAREIAQDAMFNQDALNAIKGSWTVEHCILPFQDWSKELEDGERCPGLFRLMACRALLLAVHFERLEAKAPNAISTEQDEAFDDEVQW